VNERIASTNVVDLLSKAVCVPDALAAIVVVEAADVAEFSARSVSSAEMLDIYERRLAMGRLDSLVGGREFVDALRGLHGAALRMIVVESAVGAASIWLTDDTSTVVGALAFPKPTAH
jgi:hypothetical protein